MHQIPCALGCRAYLSVWWEEGAFCVECLAVFPFLAPSPSTFHCLSVWQVPVWGIGGSWLGCQLLPVIGIVSILELAAYSGSSRMSQIGFISRTSGRSKWPFLSKIHDTEIVRQCRKIGILLWMFLGCTARFNTRDHSYFERAVTDWGGKGSVLVTRAMIQYVQYLWCL